MNKDKIVFKKGISQQIDLDSNIYEKDAFYLLTDESRLLVGKDNGYLEEVNKQKVFYSLQDALFYAQNSNLSYIGESVVVIDEDLDTVTVYAISNSLKELKQIGSSISIFNYNLLENKPQINNITLVGNKTSEDLNIEVNSITNSEIENLFIF